MKYKVLFTISYVIYLLLLLLTPTTFYHGTVLADIIIKTLVACIPLMAYVLDGDTMLCSLSDIKLFLQNKPSVKTIQTINKDNSNLFPIECLSVLKYFNYKFDSPQQLRKISAKIAKFAETHKVNIKPVRQLNGLRVNSFVYRVETFVQQNKNGSTRDIPPKEKMLSDLANELKRELGGNTVTYSLVPKSKNIQYMTAATNQNKAGLGNILRSNEYSKIIQKNKFGQVINLPVGIGVDSSGNPVSIDLNDGPMWRVVGATKMGKSKGLQTILTSLMCLFSPQELQIKIIDLKRVDFVKFKDFPQIQNICVEAEEVQNIIDDAVKEMSNRYKLLEDSQCENIHEYNSKISNKEDFVPQLMVVIDEYNETLLQSPDSNTLVNGIVRLCQAGRACGITVMLSSQRFDSGNTDTMIKSNTDGVIVFKTVKRSDSNVAIDSPLAASLLGAGDSYIKLHGQLTRVQFCLVNGDEVLRLKKMWSNKNEVK